MYSDNHHLSACIPLITPKETTGSLAIQDEFNEIDYREFLSMSRDVEEMAGLGSEPFPGTFLNPKNLNTSLPEEVMEYLVKYYHDAYEKDFAALSDIHLASSNAIPVFPKANIYGRLQLGSEIFGSTYSKRHIKSAKILSQFINGDIKDIYPGLVQFYFEHTVHFPEGSKIHALVYVRWYLPPDKKIRFHCKIGQDDKLCNVELWTKKFYELSRDCIIPVHSILGRFVEGSFSIGRREPKNYMSVIPINRKFHL